ncbi:putative sugar:hydrogen symporter protein [Thermochaetoides thermophila DSM 1495]|uniref:Putative sugar:hydrogen symporter protein n=1 Tax=Chaetomium thermophilum (strain DSM 1495 / CBS 144.50 / IMI 039719) TaxID=759272 RepID=G0SC65_CHATD|nr:putative sugar:hydrogen symporter protein [Thermochaetoides thermophila DSM 1495]EGS18991.1 putative sugar:hydrogen symporter protein [Thermochaetoides thermophila DSM 1495]
MVNAYKSSSNAALGLSNSPIPFDVQDGESVAIQDEDTAIPSGQIDPVYEKKAKVLNRAVRPYQSVITLGSVGVAEFKEAHVLTYSQIQQIGMGAYQWQLFVVISFGWASDNLWPVTTSLILPPLIVEFLGPSPNASRIAPLLTLGQSIGLLLGALFWGFGSDAFGRRWAFSLTLGATGVFGLVAAGSSSFAAASVLVAAWSFGVGGNLPVDSAIFLEFLPASHQYLLTVLSAAWAIAQVVATLLAWPLLGRMTCQEEDPNTRCEKKDNMGWRWFLLVMGGMTMLMFLARFVLFTMHESPKYLMGKGKDEDAVKVVHEVARRNGKTSTLTVEELRACEPEGYPLYNSFLPYIQATRGLDFGDGSTYLTYRDSLIIAAVGVPGAFVGALLVEQPKLGRKGTLSLATVLTGAFLYASTTAVNSNALLGWNCAYSFTSNIMYAVLYSFTPELFPTPQRGTGNALSATCNRVFGIMAPLVAIFADLNTAVPVYISGGLFIAAGLLVLFLPFESRGKAAL